MLKRAGFIALAAALLAGCSSQQMAVRLAYPLAEGQYQSLNEESDPVLAELAMPASLKMLEGMLKSDENNVPLLDRLAEGYCGYAFSFVEDDDPQRASALYLRGKNYALKSLPVYPGGANLADLGLEDYKAALRGIDRVSSLFWLSQCWAGWLTLNLDNPEAFADISKLGELLERTAELDESFHYAGPRLLLGSFYGSRTKILGGDPEKALAHFERSLKLTGNKFLVSHVLFAKTYAVQTQNRKLFENLLRKALESPADALPGQRLANEVAKIKAKKLLGAVDELF